MLYVAEELIKHWDGNEGVDGAKHPVYMYMSAVHVYIHLHPPQR